MMKIKVFLDMVCPYCYVGKLRLDQAIERLGLTDVEVFMQALQKTQTICEEGTTCGPDGCCLG